MSEPQLPSIQAHQLPRAEGYSPPAPVLRPVAVQDILDAWMANRSANTRRAYQADADAFSSWLQANGTVRDVREFLALDAGTANHLVVLYQAWMVEQELSPGTRRRRRSALNSLVKMARSIGVCHFDLDVDWPKGREQRLMEGPTRDEYADLLAAAMQQDGLERLRDVALIRLMGERALRRGEVVSLDVGHVAEKHLWVLPKGGTLREWTSVPAGLMHAIREWVAAWQSFGGKVSSEAPLFVSLSPTSRGVRLTGEGVRLILRRLSPNRRIRPHGLRHSAATHLAETGVPIHQISAFMRHRTLEAARPYLDRADQTTDALIERLAAKPLTESDDD